MMLFVVCIGLVMKVVMVLGFWNRILCLMSDVYRWLSFFGLCVNGL